MEGFNPGVIPTGQNASCKSRTIKELSSNHSTPAKKRNRHLPLLLITISAGEEKEKPATALPENFNLNCLAVDAACSGNPGPMEYRGVYLLTGQEIFHFGPVYGTNNIGEFLAIVHEIRLIEAEGIRYADYSDSRSYLKLGQTKKMQNQTGTNTAHRKIV